MTRTKSIPHAQLITAVTIVTLALISAVAYVVMQWISHSSVSKENLGVCREWQDERICTGRFLGLSEADAAVVAKEFSLVHRVVKRDGKNLFQTADYLPNRINFSVENGVVTQADFD